MATDSIENGSAFYQWRTKYLKGDPVIWFVIIVLSMMSILTVYSATGALAYRKNMGNESYLVKQLLFVGLGLLTMWFAHKAEYRNYARFAFPLLVVSIVLLIIAQIAGTTLNEASRWIRIPIINQTFQPSDLAKLALLATLASILANLQNKMEEINKFVFFIYGFMGVVCGIIALSNVSTAGILFLSCLILMYMGRVHLKFLVFYPMAIVIVVGVLAITFGQRGGTAAKRLETFISGKEVPYQVEQSFIAIANGGFTGKGPGNSDQKDSLPHPYSDFIFAIIIEEYGLIGGAFVWGLYIILLYRGMLTAHKSRDPFGGLLAAGLTFSIVIQAMLNMAVATGLVPVTGQPLPWLSMGGNSIIFTGLSFGIILSVSRGAQKQEDISTIPNAIYNKAPL